MTILAELRAKQEPYYNSQLKSPSVLSMIHIYSILQYLSSVLKVFYAGRQGSEGTGNWGRAEEKEGRRMRERRESSYGTLPLCNLETSDNLTSCVSDIYHYTTNHIVA